MGVVRKIRNRIVIVILVFMVVLVGLCVPVLLYTPKTDRVRVKDVPERYFIQNTTHIDYQEGKECAAYAAAYALRCADKEITGEELYPQMKRFLGMMTVSKVIDAIEEQGHSAKAYHGSVETLKKRLGEGLPVICMIKNGKDSHYVVAVGYDTENIYLVDSIEENATVTDSPLYNRALTTEEFEGIWKNNFYVVNHIYIVID